MKAIITKNPPHPTSPFKREKQKNIPRLTKEGGGEVIKARSRGAYGFTLVELIVVITILVILGTIGFTSMSSFSSNARDSSRSSDLTNLSKALELSYIKTGFYPDPEDVSSVTYSGGTLWKQGIIGDTTMNIINAGGGMKISKKPTDPLITIKPYSYSKTSFGNFYQLKSDWEGDSIAHQVPHLTSPYQGEEVTFSIPYQGGIMDGFLFPQANASPGNPTLSYIKGNYNGMVAKTEVGNTKYLIAIPSLFLSTTTQTGTIVLTTNTQTGFSLHNQTNSGGISFAPQLVFSSGSLPTTPTEKILFASGIANAYSGNILFANSSNIKPFITTLTSTPVNTGALESLGGNLVVGSLGGSASATQTTPVVINPVASIIDSGSCASANWFWVTSAQDVYIGTAQGNGYCISPRIGDFAGDSTGNGISWNGWGNVSNNANYSGWNTDVVSDSSANISDLSYGGQTRDITHVADAIQVYTCMPLGTATAGLTKSDNSDSTSTADDTIVNRMRYLAKYKATIASLNIINWISANAKPPGQNTFGALQLSDCIDGAKDISTDMTYTGSGGLTTPVTYASYSTAMTTPTSAALSNTTYQARQKYLLAWTQKKGSHLPSAYAYIDDSTPGGHVSSSTDLSGKARGEYQVACELSKLTDVNDKTDSEYIWLSSIGAIDGSSWGNRARMIGYDGCGAQGSNNTGFRNGINSARFVVRP